MGFWIFMLVMNLLIPFTMIGFGRLFRNSSPNDINSFYGYRTIMSMKNKDTWEYAHHHFGKTWYRLGLILLPTTIVAMLLLFGKNTNTVGTYGGIICGLQLVPLIVSIIPTEIALRKIFDENGIRKK